MTIPPTADVSSFTANMMRLMGRIEYRPARSERDKEAIYRLRYECYTREGFIDPSECDGLFKDAYDEAPNCQSFGLYLDGRIVASIRVHAATRRHPVAPGLTVFRDILGPMVEAGKVVVDSTRFVVDAAASRDNPGLAYLTARTGFMALEYHHADIALAGCRSEHRAFYKRVFAMSPLGEPRIYPSLTRPICMMAMDYPAARERIIARYPFLASSAAERDYLFGMPKPAPAENPRRLAPRPLPAGRPAAA